MTFTEREGKEDVGKRTDKDICVSSLTASAARSTPQHAVVTRRRTFGVITMSYRNDREQTTHMHARTHARKLKLPTSLQLLSKTTQLVLLLLLQ